MPVVRILRKALRVATRPVRGRSARGPLAVQPYRGYGSAGEVFMMGRVFRQPASRGTAIGLVGDLRDVFRRLLRRGLPGAEIRARFGGSEQRVRTDGDGYFRVRLHPAQPPPAGHLWHRMELELADPPGPHARGALFIPPASARHVVISDIDDTVMYTGVANTAMMLWRLFAQGAGSRIAFPGAAAFYRALHRGAGGGEANPMLYVSRGPWALYEMLEEFFRLHDIPTGPVLFLREWGIRWNHPLPRRAEDHKLSLIRHMLALYRDLPFVLVGDSGQHDPEIYARVVHEHPGRVTAVYIRNVSRDPARHRAIEQLAEELAEAGSTLVLASDTFAMAEHAAERGLISAAALSEVLAEREAEGETAPLHPTRVVRDTESPEFERSLEQERPGGAEPDNVVVEPNRRRHGRR